MNTLWSRYCNLFPLFFSQLDVLNVPVVFLSLQKKVSFEPTTSYLLKNLKPFSTYTFQLAARSKHGIGAYTNEVSIDTPQTRRSNRKYCVNVCVCE